ncbi:MAG TPA: bifunctional UDP-N-acetylmuramoyl-tripeptide:D-alanyl-D-alanine ligase/alanine racemase [Bacteroidales bacterium]|nr:bifunctional UDP-N-acetylmuramoyl-tripeptide:D-alanyl-D-alanine ligase/alanine racemase [Bacteroidales bacterium]HOS71055.1 bifunctional UDP-N-acetylmuramoyl-tripeptide:D-alanyl-D-alanine ligase/alanine racemase [Bacteroidales bacterium]HQH24181.1 bifunctional UDP-N-acetylmuramoyl-tripeptide:D-alanyl-D-alanine ligase/alanine racemase [Bacteroidales bacterium]HQJ81805.1 bifunctional UDP-N-acetylmuramoyl-tripeptide:D-alanyl-D-alanine ligase/alanine racemase [Bacteroidales bacterium]
MKFSSSDIAEIISGRLSGDPDLTVTEVLIDSRNFKFSEGVLFFAIRGKNHDGHDFIESLYSRGIRVFVVERLPRDMEKFEGAAVIETSGSVAALQKLAAHVRKSFRPPVIAVTGSAGKTIVKEWLADILGMTASVVRSPRSYNSQTGVPLSVLRLEDKYQYGIFEAGISLPGEMGRLRDIIDPDIGIITNIGDAHSENFSSLEEKAREKLELFRDTSVLIYCRDHRIIHELISGREVYAGKQIADWSVSSDEAAIRVEKISGDGRQTHIRMGYRGRDHFFSIPFSDRASVDNAVTAACACLVLGTDAEVIRQGLASLVSVAMRMELKAGINNCQLIEDYYNSDPGSLGMALDYLRAQNNRKTTLILSDFVQSGRDEKELYSEVSGLIRQNGTGRFIGIGPVLSANRSLFGGDPEFYYSTDEFIQRFTPSAFRDETILLKGARKFEFEKIAALLEQQVHQTVLEINLDAIAHNLNEYRRRIRPGTAIMAMVKAFAYGSGHAETAALLEYHRVGYLGVAYADEGVELRNAGITLPVMVMNPDPSAFELMIRYDLEPEIYSFRSFERFRETALKYGLVGYPVHIKIDTGMHRLGFMPGDADRLASLVRSSESMKIVSVFSHFAASEDPALDHFTHRQAALFTKVAEKLREATGYSFIRHICNSSAIIRFPEYHFEMVRPGIGLYGTGYFNAGDADKPDLKPAGRYMTRISQVKTIPAGEPVGYGCAAVADSDRVIAILPVGYADGLNRKLGNGNGSLFIKNRRVPIIGNICMDMCMADISGVDAGEGDEAEIFGQGISIAELAGKCGTIPYEILTSIPPRVKRVFFRE